VLLFGVLVLRQALASRVPGSPADPGTDPAPADPGSPADPGTPAPAGCVQAAEIEAATHGGKVIADLNDGDPFAYSLTIITPDVPSGEKTVAFLTEKGYIFDITYPVMYFTSYRLVGTLDQAVCSAAKLTGGNAAGYVFIGSAPAPTGWTNPSDVTGWWGELVVKQYSEDAIDIGVEAKTFQIATDDTSRAITAMGITHGQFWNPAVDGIVVHPQVEKGYTLTIPDREQGTGWAIIGGNAEKIQERIIQTSKEVVDRDNILVSKDKTNLTLLYCGSTPPPTALVIGDVTVNWTTSLTGWTCTQQQ
jgi:hypothetical protein